MKTRSDSELSKKKWRNNSSESDFFETFWAHSSGGFEGLAPSLFICSVIFSLRFHPVSSLVLFILSSFSSCIFSCLVHFSLLFHPVSSLVLCRLSSFIFSCLLVFVPSSLSSSLVLSCLAFSVSLCLSLCLSVCLSLCLRVMLCVLCLCCVCRCGRGVVWWSWCVWCVCVCVCVLRHAEKSGKNPCMGSKSSPCVHSQRPRVCRHHAHMLRSMYAWCRYTRGRFERTHGDVLNPHTEGKGVFVSSAYQNLPHVWSSLAPQRSTKETNGSYPFSV